MSGQGVGGGGYLWEHFDWCESCGSKARRCCRDENLRPAKMCKGRKRLPSKPPTVDDSRLSELKAARITIVSLRSDLADRTEQVQSLTARAVAAEKKLADIHALSK